MLRELNQGRTDPQILAFPNEHHPDDPLVCLIEYDAVFPKLRAILEMYAHLSEF